MYVGRTGIIELVFRVYLVDLVNRNKLPIAQLFVMLGVRELAFCPPA